MIVVRVVQRSDVDALMRLVPGPDLPTGGQLLGLDEVRRAYETGRGVVRMRARAGCRAFGARCWGAARRCREGHRRAAGVCYAAFAARAPSPR